MLSRESTGVDPLQAAGKPWCQYLLLIDPTEARQVTENALMACPPRSQHRLPQRPYSGGDERASADLLKAQVIIDNKLETGVAAWCQGCG